MKQENRSFAEEQEDTEWEIEIVRLVKPCYNLTKKILNES